MPIAASADGLPLLDIFWALLSIFALLLALWLLLTVLIDVFDRADLSRGARVGWAVLVVLIPLLASLGYLVTRSRDAGELRMVGFRGRLPAPPRGPDVPSGKETVRVAIPRPRTGSVH